VSLSGAVPDESRRQLARDTARRTAGVVELHDLLRIK
jgi:osmotically-inducible protein OsmY